MIYYYGYYVLNHSNASLHKNMITTNINKYRSSSVAGWIDIFPIMEAIPYIQQTFWSCYMTRFHFDMQYVGFVV